MHSGSVNKLRKSIRNFLKENVNNIFEYDEDMIDEERIANTDSKEFVKRRENFIGSHIYGEDLGGLGKMYVAYSYGTQYPAFVWFDDKWYHNTDDYLLDDGSTNEFTKIHMDLMRPSLDTHGLSTYHLQKMINDFMKENGIDGVTHTSVEPGIKN